MVNNLDLFLLGVFMVLFSRELSILIIGLWGKMHGDSLNKFNCWLGNTYKKVFIIDRR